MPKPNFVITGFQKNELYKQLCLQIGFPIRTKLDCKKVSELIEHAGLSSISESTIYRLFLLSTNENHPYLHTLNILVQFCGYQDWNEFETVQNESEQFVFGFGKFQTNNSNFKSLIAVCIHTDELKPLLLYTEQFDGHTNEIHKAKFAEEIFNPYWPINTTIPFSKNSVILVSFESISLKYWPILLFQYLDMKLEFNII